MEKSDGVSDDTGLTLKEYIAIVLEEYKVVWAASLQCDRNMFATFSTGLAAVGVLMALGINVSNTNRTLAVFIFSIFVPLLVTAVAFIWVGEAARYRKVGDMVCVIEIKLSRWFAEHPQVFGGSSESWRETQDEILKKLKQPPTRLNLLLPAIWEQWLKDARVMSKQGVRWYHWRNWFQPVGHLIWVYAGRLLFFGLILITSFVLSLVFVYQQYQFDKKQISLSVLCGFPFNLLAIWVMFIFLCWACIFLAARNISLEAQEPLDLSKINSPNRKLEELVGRKENHLQQAQKFGGK